MKTSDFDYALPDELIARYPLNTRSDSRLLYLDQGQVQHRVFSELPDLLSDRDVIIFNNTRVIPARLFARKLTGGKIEMLIERILDEHIAIAHIKSNKPLALPCPIVLENNVTVTIVERHDSLFKVKFNCDQSVNDLLLEIGHIPLPNYMQRGAEESDQQRYQTIYAKRDGAVAAPTAGLHFDPELMERIQQKGIKTGFITLHVGAGTFKPVVVANVAEHQMHHEVFEISPEVCELVNEAKSSGKRIIAVGTTTVRALETAMQDKAWLAPCAGETNIFIYPGYEFRCIDALITNFHLPKSTLLMLVCALGGYQEVMSSYEIAIHERYRFYSYGDAMLLSRVAKPK